MTYLQKFRAEHPESEEDDKYLIGNCCPEDVTKCPQITGGLDECAMCWKTEVPENGRR